MRTNLIALGCWSLALLGCSGGGTAAPLLVTASTSDPVATLGVATISVAGGRAPYQVEIVDNASGGSVLFDGVTVTYWAGTVGGLEDVGVADAIEVSDAAGNVETVTFDVVSTAFAGFVERYGTSDPWRVNFDAKRFAGAHAYDSDLHAELVRLGLRTDGATGEGADHDQLAAALVELRILRHVSLFCLNDPDGTPSTHDISLFARTPATGSAPPPGTAFAGGPGLYNVMEVSTQDVDGVLGRAFLDAGNGAIEHDGGETSGGSKLGVDITDCTSFYLSSHPGNVLVPAVGAGDVGGLLRLINGEAPAEPREQELLDLVDHFAYRIAMVVTHEIGHSLGLDHNGTSGSIMFPSFSFGDGTSPAFLPAEVAVLGTDLPGPGRGGGSLTDGPGQWSIVVLDTAEVRADENGGVRCTCGVPVWPAAEH